MNAAASRARTPAYGLKERTLSMDVDGIAAEYALARAVGLADDWEPSFERDDQEGDVIDKNGHPWHARGTTLTINPHLPLHPPPKDPEAHRHALVILDNGWAEVVGWVWGHEGKQQEHWRKGIRHPCFMVPQSALRPFTLADYDDWQPVEATCSGCGRSYLQARREWRLCLQCTLGTTKAQHEARLSEGPSDALRAPPGQVSRQLWGPGR